MFFLFALFVFVFFLLCLIRIYAVTRSLREGVDCAETLRLFEGSMKSYWDRGVGRVYLHSVCAHFMNEAKTDYRPTVRYALHLDLGNRHE